MNGNNTLHFSRGRVALHAILQAMEIGPGSEVIVPAFTCLAVPLPILHVGATPIYLDVTEQTYNIDLSKLSRLITPRTRAIIAQHTFGIPLEMDTLLEIARRHNLYVIEDCCHSLTSTYRGTVIGQFGHAGFCSYEWGKPIVLGGGGTAWANDPVVRKALEAIYRSSGSSPRMDSILIWLQRKMHAMILSPSRYWQLRAIFRFLGRFRFVVQTFTKEEVRGHMAHCNERMAPFLLRRLQLKIHQMERDKTFRNNIVSIYEHELEAMNILRFHVPPHWKPVFLRYPLLVKDKQRVIQKARERRVEIGDWFTSPVHPLNEMEWEVVHYINGSCPVAESIAKHIITFPIYRKINAKEVEKSVAFIRDLFRDGLIAPAEAEVVEDLQHASARPVVDATYGANK